MLALMALLEPGSPVMVTEPGYPCHRHMASVSGGTVYATALSPESGWCLGAAGVAGDWQAGTRVLMLTTPGNPTGAVLGISELAEVVDEVRGRGAAVIVDESYQGLVYDAEDVSALACGAAGVFVVNSFSKYFGLTGWRLGWLVVPPGWAPIIERLAQNLYLAPPTLSQHLALEALKPSMQAQLADRRQDLRARRDLLLGALPRLGLALPSAPQGAFYAFIGMPAGHADAASFAEALLEGVDVAVTPGTDFGGLVAAGMLRVAYTESAPRLRIGLDRIGEFLDAA